MVREVIVMTRRYFWQIKGSVRFRTVFETDETILGVNEKAGHKLFRKDTGSVTFDDPTARKRVRARLAGREPVTKIVRLVPRLIPRPV
jgi:hypothetical protein